MRSGSGNCNGNGSGLPSPRWKSVCVRSIPPSARPPLKSYCCHRNGGSTVTIPTARYWLTQHKRSDPHDPRSTAHTAARAYVEEHFQGGEFLLYIRANDLHADFFQIRSDKKWMLNKRPCIGRSLVSRLIKPSLLRSCYYSTNRFTDRASYAYSSRLPVGSSSPALRGDVFAHWPSRHLRIKSRHFTAPFRRRLLCVSAVGLDFACPGK